MEADAALRSESFVIAHSVFLFWTMVAPPEVMPDPRF
jgi:hypothetical protein